MEPTIKNCPHFWKTDTAGEDLVYCSNCLLSKSLSDFVYKGDTHGNS